LLQHEILLHHWLLLLLASLRHQLYLLLELLLEFAFHFVVFDELIGADVVVELLLDDVTTDELFRL